MYFCSIFKAKDDVTFDVHRYYTFEGFNILDETSTQLIAIYLELIGKGLLKYHAQK